MVIRELRSGRWDSDLWYGWLRSKQVYRVLVTGKQGSAATVFGVFSLLITIILYLLSSGSVTFTRLELIVGTCLILIASAIAGGVWALRTMSPVNYAQTTIGGCTASETLQFISLDVRKACAAFEKRIRPVETAFKVALNSPGSDQQPAEARFPQDFNFLSKPLDKLRRQSSKDHIMLLRIAALSELASQQLDIPLHRLQELVIEYDPAVHRVHGGKFLQNLELLVSGAKLNSRHQENLRKDNAAIIERSRSRIRAQDDMLVYTALHSSILRMAAVHSTAQAVQEYARAISTVAELTCKHTPNQMTAFDEESEFLLTDGISALRFLACRQRAHSGFDLNQTCLNMVALELRRNNAIEMKWKALEELGRSINKEDKGAFNGQHRYTGKECIEPRTKIESLIDLWGLTIEHIQKDREKIVANFGQMYQGWTKNHRKTTKSLIVTHGFSTTVREVLKRSLPINGKDIPDIFVIGSGEIRDLDSRLMVSSLLEVTPDQRRFGRIAAGDRNTLAKLVETDMKVMVVLGAECFDRKGRVIHPFGLEEVEFIKSKLGNPAAFCVVVVAEGYKFHEDILSIPQSFRYHLDRIQLYEPDLIDVIVTTEVQCVSDSSSSISVPLTTELRTPDRNRHILRRPFDHKDGLIAREFMLELPSNVDERIA